MPLALDWNATSKFYVSLVVWAALLAGSISVTIVAENSSNSPAYVNYSLLGVGGALFVVFVFSILSLWPRELYKRPDSLADKSPKLSWSHILAVVTTFVESLQLSAVVIYFFGTIGSYGGDGFSQVLMWGSYSHNDNAFKISTYIACLLVLIGGILVALPLAASGEGARRRAKILLFKESPLYDFAMSVITRLLTVWIIATLMRSTSCVNDATTMESVLSTDPSISCGGDNLWSSRASITLLSFFTITSSIMHSDDANLLAPTSAAASKLDTVKFAPLYAITIRTAQLAVCALSMGAFWSASAITPLIPILLITLVIGISPLVYPSDVCSFAAVSPLRSAGCISVTWTALVCIVRHTASNNGGVFAFGSAIYIGWGLIFSVGLILALWQERIQYLNSIEAIRQSGLVEVIEQLLSACDKLILTEAVPISTHQRLANLRKSILSSRTSEELVNIVLSLEASILADRLSPVFLRGRNRWISRLKNVHTTSSSSDTTNNEPLRSVSDEFGLVKREVTRLSNNICPLAPITLVSRQVFTILLSQRIPQDVCWFIFEFVTDSTQLSILLNEYKGLSQKGYQGINLRGWRSKNFSITRHGYMLACSFIYERKAAINAVDTHQPDIYVLEDVSHQSVEDGERNVLRGSNTVDILHEVEPSSSIQSEYSVLESEIMNEVIQSSLEEM